MTIPKQIEATVIQEDWNSGFDSSLPKAELQDYADCCVLAKALLRQLGLGAAVHDDGSIRIYDSRLSGLGEEYAADLAGQALINDFDALLQDKLETMPTFPIKVALTRVD